MTDGTEGAAQAAPAETPASGGDSLPSAADIMAFDPFGPSSDLPSEKVAPDGGTTPPPTADDKGQQSPPASGTPPLKAGEQPPPSATPPVDPKATPAAPAMTPAPTQPQPQPDLAQLIQQQTQTIQQALATTKPEAKPGAAEAPPPKYNLGLPPQIVKALRSEDEGEFAGGMHAIINGIANRIWEDVSTHLQEYVSQQVPTMISSHAQGQTVQQQVATDFYGKYPTLQQDLLKPLIQQVGFQIVQQRQAQGLPVAWGPEIRDAIAETIFTQLPQLRPAAAAAPSGTPAPQGGGQQPPGKPPFATGGGSRPVPAAPNEFAELLN